MKKFLLAALLGLVVVVGVVAAVGYALPQEHVASRGVVIGAAPDAVFDVVADVARYADWRRDVSKVDVLQSTPLRWREHSGRDAVTFEAVESRRPEHLRVRIADRDLPFGGTWTYELVPEGTGRTRLTITEHGEVYNPIFRFVSRFVIGHTATLDAYLADLQRRIGS